MMSHMPLETLFMLNMRPQDRGSLESVETSLVRGVGWRAGVYAGKAETENSDKCPAEVR